MLLTLGNPKAVIFFGAVLPQVFDLGALTPWTFLPILAVGLSIDLAAQCLYVFSASRLRELLRSERHVRLVNRIAGGTMLGAATTIAVRR